MRCRSNSRRWGNEVPREAQRRAWRVRFARVRTARRRTRCLRGTRCTRLPCDETAALRHRRHSVRRPSARRASTMRRCFALRPSEAWRDCIRIACRSNAGAPRTATCSDSARDPTANRDRIDQCSGCFPRPTGASALHRRTRDRSTKPTFRTRCSVDSARPSSAHCPDRRSGASPGPRNFRRRSRSAARARPMRRATSPRIRTTPPSPCRLESSQLRAPARSRTIGIPWVDAQLRSLAVTHSGQTSERKARKAYSRASRAVRSEKLVLSHHPHE